MYVITDNRDLVDSDVASQAGLAHWPVVAAWWSEWVKYVGPYKERTTVLFVPIDVDTGLAYVHPTWAGTFILDACVYLFPTINFALIERTASRSPSLSCKSSGDLVTAYQSVMLKWLRLIPDTRARWRQHISRPGQSTHTVQRSNTDRHLSCPGPEVLRTLLTPAGDFQRVHPLTRANRLIMVGLMMTTMLAPLMILQLARLSHHIPQATKRGRLPDQSLAPPVILPQ